MNASEDGTADQESTLLTPRILIPFLFISLVWGSTWLVIKDQISDVPPSWSVSYRFIVAAAAMFILVAFKRLPFRLGRTGQFWAMLIGIEIGRASCRARLEIVGQGAFGTEQETERRQE